MGDSALRRKVRLPRGRAERGAPVIKSLASSAEHVRSAPVLGHDVRFLHRAFSRALAERLAFHGITGTQWTALRALWEEDGCSQVVLAQRISVVKASLTPVLHGLERKGLIQRSQGKDDRRVSNVCLTKKGKALEGTLLPVMEEVNAMASRGLSEDELRIFLRILWKMAENLS